MELVVPAAGDDFALELRAGYRASGDCYEVAARRRASRRHSRFVQRYGLLKDELQLWSRRFRLEPSRAATCRWPVGATPAPRRPGWVWAPALGAARKLRPKQGGLRCLRARSHRSFIEIAFRNSGKIPIGWRRAFCRFSFGFAVYTSVTRNGPQASCPSCSRSGPVFITLSSGHFAAQAYELAAPAGPLEYFGYSG